MEPSLLVAPQAHGIDDALKVRCKSIFNCVPWIGRILGLGDYLSLKDAATFLSDSWLTTLHINAMLFCLCAQVLDDAQWSTTVLITSASLATESLIHLTDAYLANSQAEAQDMGEYSCPLLLCIST
jgi:hypothetical protein